MITDLKKKGKKILPFQIQAFMLILKQGVSCIVKKRFEISRQYGII